MAQIALNSPRRCIYSALPMQVFMIHAIKKPLVEGIHIIFEKGMPMRRRAEGVRQIRQAIRNMGKLPEPTIENTWHPNTHNLILLRVWAFERYRWLGRTTTRKLINFAIIIHAFDPPWRWMMESVLIDALKMEWTGGVYWGWWKDTHNLILLRDQFFRRCYLSDARLGFVRRIMNCAIFLHAVFPPCRSMLKACLGKTRQMKWEPQMYGHGTVPQWGWWREQ